MVLDQSQITQFEETGHLVVESLISTAELETVRERMSAIAEGRVKFPAAQLEFEPGLDDDLPAMQRLRKINEGSQFDPVFMEHARNPAIVDAIEGLLGPDLKLFGDQMFVKPPGGAEKTYHQDCPYFSIAPMAMITTWVAIDEVDEENGCMYVIPGSHNFGAVDHSEPWIVGTRRDMRIPDAVIDRQRERPITLREGGCSFHHGLLQHRSGPNRTDRFRRGLATHYMSAQSCWTGDAAQPAYHLLHGREYEGCV